MGIGAHADVGIKDGKLKVDIGASLGIGASIGFELDVGGTVKAVQEVSKSIFDGLKNGVKSLFGK